METNAGISGKKQDLQTPTKICVIILFSLSVGNKDVSKAAIWEAVKNLTSMVESFNSQLNEDSLTIANLAIWSLDFNIKEIKDCKDKVKTLENVTIWDSFFIVCIFMVKMTSHRTRNTLI